jgi:hypothetical protein
MTEAEKEPRPGAPVVVLREDNSQFSSWGYLRPCARCRWYRPVRLCRNPKILRNPPLILTRREVQYHAIGSRWSRDRCKGQFYQERSP